MNGDQQAFTYYNTNPINFIPNNINYSHSNIPTSKSKYRVKRPFSIMNGGSTPESSSQYSTKKIKMQSSHLEPNPTYNNNFSNLTNYNNYNNFGPQMENKKMSPVFSRENYKSGQLEMEVDNNLESQKK